MSLFSYNTKCFCIHVKSSYETLYSVIFFLCDTWTKTITIIVKKKNEYAKLWQVLHGQINSRAEQNNSFKNIFHDQQLHFLCLIIWLRYIEPWIFFHLTARSFLKFYEKKIGKKSERLNLWLYILELYISHPYN